MGIRHIRKSIFKVSQGELAEIAGTTQATVSRWEAGELEPNRAQMDRIRTEAERRSLPWNNDWFFGPDVSESVGAAA